MVAAAICLSAWAYIGAPQARWAAHRLRSCHAPMLDSVTGPSMPAKSVPRRHFRRELPIACAILVGRRVIEKSISTLSAQTSSMAATAASLAPCVLG